MWLLVVVGVLAGDVAGSMLCARWGARGVPPAGAPLQAQPPAISSASPRRLRSLPGIGEKRAAAIAAERWRLAPGRERGLADVPGLGEGTERRVRAHLDAAAPGAPGPAPGGGPPEASVHSLPAPPGPRLGHPASPLEPAGPSGPAGPLRGAERPP